LVVVAAVVLVVLVDVVVVVRVNFNQAAGFSERC